MSPRLILGGTVFLAALGSAYYVVDLRKDLSDALSDNEKLHDSVEAQKAVIETQERDIRQIQSVNSRLGEIVSRKNAELRELDEKFSASGSEDPRDFGEITMRKPGLVEGIVNAATAEVNRCFEIITGSPVTDSDLSNDECKGVIDDAKED